jgi:hypothetical protein
VFMGDSLMRYQYLDLAYGIAGKDGELRRASMNPLQENTWRSWQRFLDGTTESLSPHETCDCHRDDPTNYSTVAENRVFHLSACDVTVAFVLVFGSKLVNGHWGEPHQLARSSPKASASKHTWYSSESHLERSSWTDVVSQHIAALRPTALVLSASLWPMEGLNLSALRAVAARTAPCVVWKTASQHALWIDNWDGPKQARKNDAAARVAFADDVIFEAAAASEGIWNETRRRHTLERLKRGPAGCDMWWDCTTHFTPKSGANRVLNVKLLSEMRKRCAGRPTTVVALAGL